MIPFEFFPDEGNVVVRYLSLLVSSCWKRRMDIWIFSTTST